MAPDRDDWATIVARVLPFVLPRECSGTKHEQTVGMRDGNSLVATRCVELPPHRQVPAVNPTGTCMPSASIRSIMAAAAKATLQPLSTNQPQAEKRVYPFSQCKQAVIHLKIRESSTQLPTGARPLWADMSMNDQDGDLDGSKPLVDKVADNSQRSIPSSPPSYPLFDRAWTNSVKWEQRELAAKPILVAAFDYIGFRDPSGTADDLLQESWNDILSIVKTKNTLTAWVHTLRAKNPAPRLPQRFQRPLPQPTPAVLLPQWCSLCNFLHRLSCRARS